MEPPTEGKKLLSQVCLGRKVSRRSMTRAVGSNQKYEYMHGFRTAKKQIFKKRVLVSVGSHSPVETSEVEIIQHSERFITVF